MIPYGRYSHWRAGFLLAALAWISCGQCGDTLAESADHIAFEAADNGLGFSGALIGWTGLSEKVSIGVEVEDAVAVFTHRKDENLLGMSPNSTGFDLHERFDLAAVDLFIGLHWPSESRWEFLRACDLGVSRYAIHQQMMIWDPAHPPAFRGTAKCW